MIDNVADSVYFKRDSDYDPADNYFQILLDCYDLGFMEDAILFVLSEESAPGHFTFVNSTYEKFLKGCRNNFKTRVENKVDAFNYFKYILNRFQLVKSAVYMEKNNQIFHRLLKNPISEESNYIGKLEFYKYKCINNAIETLEEYVKLLTPTNVVSIEKNPPIPPPKIKGYRIKNKDCLIIAYERLRSLYIIHGDVKQKDFEDSF